MGMQCTACAHENGADVRFCANCGALLPVPTSAEDPMINSVVGGRYRIVSLLGEGGMGRVYKAEQQMGTAVRQVAVKTLLKELSSDPQVVARFMRECGTVVGLEHPNTIKFYDFGQTDSADLYIAMEFLDGEAMADLIAREGALASDRVLRIMEQVCGSLHEAHNQGVVHRDLKPDNVVLTTRLGRQDFVKVLDFGIAKQQSPAANAEKLTQAGMVLGTPPYMSPEQFTGVELDQRSDIYSLAVMAYEMLTGKLPFDAETPWEWASRHMTQPPTPFERLGPLGASVPEHMKTAVMRALSKEPVQRQQSAMAFYEELGGGGVAASARTVAGVSGADLRQSTAPADPQWNRHSGIGTGTQAAPVFPAQTPGPMPAHTPGPMRTAVNSGYPVSPGHASGGYPAPPVHPSGGYPAPPGHPSGGYPAPPGHPAGGYPSSPRQHVPTAGGQAIPAPPARQAVRRNDSGRGLLIFGAFGAAALVVLAVFFGAGSSSADDEEDIPTIAAGQTEETGDNSETDDPSKGETEVRVEPPEDDNNTVAMPTPPSPNPKYPQPHNPQPHNPRPPSPQLPPPAIMPVPPPPRPPPPVVSSSCESAIAHARSKNCVAARAALSGCTGFRQRAARANVRRYCR